MDAVHPVLTVLKDRRRRGSRPLHRDDAHRVALAIDGGGMRGVVSGSMLAAIRDLGYGSAFDAVYGVSAGAINGAYFITGDGWPALTVYYDEMTTRSFIDWRRALRGQPIVSVGFIIDEVMEKRYPLNYGKVVGSDVPLYVIVTSVHQGKWRAEHTADSPEKLRLLLRASASIPVAAGAPVEMDGDTYVDGAVSLAHPALAAIEDGCSHIVVLRTRARVTPHSLPSMGRVAMTASLLATGGKLVKSFNDTRRQYAHLDALIDRDSQCDSPYLLDVSCRPGAHSVGPTTQRMDRLMEGMRVGYQSVVETFEGLPGRAFLRPVTIDPDNVG